MGFYLLPITNLPITHYPLPITHYPLLITHYLIQMTSEVKAISGRGIPLVGNDIDTDRIIPARFLRCVTFDGLGEHAFEDDRKALAGKHPFDQPQYKGANILVVNRNFGCGSSREHAPQAISKWGIQALIGESFAEIFFGNCVAMGIPCVTMDPEKVKEIQQTLTNNPQAGVSINLENDGRYYAVIFPHRFQSIEVPEICLFLELEMLAVS